MSVAEFFLRLGVVLVGWLTVLAHGTWLAALRAVDCANGGPEPWLLTFVAAPVVAAFACALPLGRRLPGVASLLRLPGLLLILLLPLAAWTVVETFWAVNLRSGSICGATDAPWAFWWAPVQLFVLAVIGLFAVKSW
jgi:hypothetical protein